MLALGKNAIGERGSDHLLAFSSPRAGVGVPPGYTRSTINGEPMTYLGFPVYDNGVNIIYLEN